jgi:phospholipid/cholesterol/gamma-HCH transport system ATP-binding protein
MHSASEPSATGAPMIEVEDLTIGYGERVVLEKLDFAVPSGQVFAILGGSGCGKSTLLRHLIGLETPMDGTIRIAGAPPVQEVGAPTYGVLFQSGALFGSMTLAQNVALPLRTWSDLDLQAIDTIVRAKLRLVGLEGFENHLPAELSGGMKKRAGIARALALDPPLLFLDEPSAGLDPVSSYELDQLLLTLNSSLGMTTVIVTHELQSIFAVADQCIMLDRSARGIIARGHPATLRDTSSDPRVRAFFNRQSAPS